MTENRECSKEKEPPILLKTQKSVVGELCAYEAWYTAESVTVLTVNPFHSGTNILFCSRGMAQEC
jgi:hypothetical protein